MLFSVADCLLQSVKRTLKMSAKRIRRPTMSNHVRPGNVAAAVMRAAKGHWVTERSIVDAFVAHDMLKACLKVGAYAVGDVKRYQLGNVENRRVVNENGVVSLEYRLINFRLFDQFGFNAQRCVMFDSIVPDADETVSETAIDALLAIENDKLTAAALTQ